MSGTWRHTYEREHRGIYMYNMCNIYMYYIIYYIYIYYIYLYIQYILYIYYIYIYIYIYIYLLQSRCNNNVRYISKLLKTHFFAMQIFRSHFGSFFCARYIYDYIYIYIIRCFLHDIDSIFSCALLYGASRTTLHRKKLK